ncbi:flagellar filament capping protein FliD [Telluria aromaticivorans]|uniref:Flagellar hook-associated protein 2 n=1 Tax=Telluria aromaticivorans TaxID=2725995 RepID=A0A7Y2K0E6_9BURK|nr:flagellar filament capping protein FliD [Telluria aromaticivorans]NNG24320.1 flagellar filament capping protein FliD [Telluria aromaticivorans]
MASAITAPSYDPITTANSLADKYVMARQKIIDAQSAAAKATEKGLTDLGSAMTAFQTSLAALTGLNKNLYAQSATFSDTTVGSATAGATAAPGNYSFFVAKLATASQVSYAGLTDNAGVSGTLNINMGGSLAFAVNLNAADTDGDLTLSTRELAAAINSATGNTSMVTASIVTTGATSELVLTAKNTGLDSAITIDTTGISGASSLASANADPLRRRTLVVAQDAEIRIGSESGTPITQASNTFTNIAGVKMTFTKAQAPGSAPVAIAVGADSKNTIANVQAFVDAYNKLKGVLNKLTDSGDPSKGAAGGSFAHDGGIRALNDRLVTLLRPTTVGDTLASFGIIATKDGTLELNSERLQRQLALKPTGLDTLIGSSSVSSPSGIAGALDKFIKGWSNTADGQIKQRKEQTSNLQSTLADRQAFLEQQHEAAYNRYLRQFTALQSLQGAMTNNLSMFDALFGNNKD